MYCQSCGAFNADDAHFCFACGQDLQPNSSQEAQHQSLSEEQLWSHFLGEKNPNYFLTRFRQFAEGGSIFSWNTVAFFFTAPWMLYRKMWQAWILYSLVNFVLFILLGAFKGSGLMLFIALVIQYGVMPMLANYFYFKKVSKVCEDIDSIPNVQQSQVIHLLRKRGGTSLWWIPAALLPLIMIVAAIALPAYHAYQSKSHQQSFSGAMRYSYELQKSIDRYYAQHGSTPYSLQDVGVDTHNLPSGVQNVMWQSDRDKLLIWVPSAEKEAWLEFEAEESGSELNWRCQAMNLPKEMVPSGCRP